MTSNRLFAAAAATAAFAVAALPAFAGHSATGNGGVKLSTTLSGGAEVPGPGDSNGSGTFSARINPGQGELCYSLTVTRIDPATMAHIHTGAAGVAGPVLVTLAAPTGGRSQACIAIDREVAMKLIKHPERFYVNVHNATFPAGAVRGQLAK